MAKKDSVKWSDLKKILQDTDKNELVDLIRDLYKRSTDDRRFITANDRRFITARYMDAISGDLKGQMLEKYRKIIVNEFFPDRGEEKLRYSVAKKLSVITRKLPGTRKGRWTLCSHMWKTASNTPILMGILTNSSISIFMECCQRSATSSGKKKSFTRCSGRGCSRSARIRAI